MATNSRHKTSAPEPSPVSSAGAVLDGDTWTGLDAFARAAPAIVLRPPNGDRRTPLSRPQDSPHGAEFHPDTATLVGLDDLANFRGNDLIALRDYQLKEQDQRNRRSIQNAVLLATIGVIVLTLILVVVAVGGKWITEDFGEFIISLVLTAALSGLGGAVAWAFRATSADSPQRSRPKPTT